MESDGKRFLIRPLKSEDLEEVSNLLCKVFSEREPISNYLAEDPNVFYANICKPWTEESIKEELSFVCLDTKLEKGNQIIGFRLSQTLKKPVNESKLDENENISASKCLNRLVFEYKTEWFEKHPQFASDAVDAPKCFFFLALGVKDGYENYKIASRLLEYSINHAKINGFQYVFVIASAAAAQHMFEKKFHFTPVTSKDYKTIEYKGNYYLKGISNPSKLFSYELDLSNWDIALHPDLNSF